MVCRRKDPHSVNKKILSVPVPRALDLGKNLEKSGGRRNGVVFGLLFLGIVLPPLFDAGKGLWLLN